MKVRELREAVPGDTLLWIETEQEEYREAGENSRLSCKYDDVTIVQMFPQLLAITATAGLELIEPLQWRPR